MYPDPRNTLSQIQENGDQKIIPSFLIRSTKPTGADTAGAGELAGNQCIRAVVIQEENIRGMSVN